jgi:P-type Cu2+ transporter
MPTNKTQYTCPMHPEETSDKPGLCRQCNMALEKDTQSKHNSQHSGHDKHEGHSPNMFKAKFWVSFALTLPVVYFSGAIQELLGYSAVQFAGSQYISAVLGLFIFFYGGIVFIRSAKYELAAKKPGMMTLISLAISVAFLYSLAISLRLVEGMDFWWELASLITIMLLGHWLEMASVSKTQGALKQLAKLLPDIAELKTKTGTSKVSTADLKVGDSVLVRPGTRVPIDGKVTEGESKVDESMITGESALISKKRDDSVVGGTINKNGSLTVEVTKVGEDTTLSGIMRIVSEAQASKSKTQLLADKAAGYLTYVAILAAFLTALGWSLLSSFGAGFMLERVVTVLVIACPHALGLAIPLVTSISTTKAANSGLLIRERSALELAKDVDVVLFDKTGTLTKGEQGVVSLNAKDEKQLMSIAASLEKDSEHPIASAIVKYAKSKKVKLSKVTKFKNIEGMGVKAKIGSQYYYVGGPKLIEYLDASLNESQAKLTNKAYAKGHTVVYVFKNKTVLGQIDIADVIRPESRSAIKQLIKAGKEIAMITGDAEGVAKAVSDELGIKQYFAEVLPKNKSDVVKQLQQEGKTVAMVGDGVNDAPALAQADIGIAIGAGTDVAIESAGIVLASSDPRGVLKVLRLSKATYTKMVQNLVWATGYNVLAIPLAAGVMFSYGFVLSPALGAVLMSASTVIVAVNAQLLRRVRV